MHVTVIAVCYYISLKNSLCDLYVMLKVSVIISNPVQRVPGLFWGKVAGAWCSPPTPSSAEDANGLETYLPPLCACVGM